MSAPLLQPFRLRMRQAKLGRVLALLEEARLRSASERLAVGADRLGLAGIGLALLQEARLGGARERLAVGADGLARTGIIRHGGAHGEQRKNSSSEDALHRRPLSRFWIWIRCTHRWHASTARDAGTNNNDGIRARTRS